MVLPDDSSWIAEVLTNNTLVCVTGRSYNQKKAPDLCGAGWKIYFKETLGYVSGSLIERSNSASSYRGELLGMLTIYLFLLTTKKYCDVSGTK